MSELHKVSEWRDIDSAIFHNEIVVVNKPAVIRSLNTEWPAVVESRGSPEAACHYLQSLDSGQPVYTIAAPPEAGGRFFYDEDLQGLNFKRGQIPLTQVLSQLLRQGDDSGVHAIAVQALAVREILPDFEKENRIRLVNRSVSPTMWIGNRGRVAPHYDVHRNLACVVAGRRQFILYPPEQIGNLYLGPVLDAPGGVPVSLVDVWNPDLEKYPRYVQALDQAFEAILEPGDALYIPSLWWHGVASLEHVNVLVNYWWDGISASGISPNDSLLHAMLSIPDLDDAQRQAWQQFFDYYVFRNGEDPAGHLPGNLHDIVTKLTPEQDATIREFLSARLKKTD